LRQQSLLISLKILQNTNIKRHFTHVLIALKKQNSYFVILMLFTSQKILSLFKHCRNKTPTSLSTSSNYTNVDLGKGIITLTSPADDVKVVHDILPKHSWIEIFQQVHNEHALVLWIHNSLPKPPQALNTCCIEGA